MGRLGSLKYQIGGELSSQLRIGEKKHEVRKEEGTRNPDGIFSWKTYDDYKRCCCQYADWVKKAHPGTNRLDQAKKYVAEYLQERIDRGLSTWTVKLDRAALSKLYHCTGADWGVNVPDRRRQDITRSRHDTELDKHFSVTKNANLVAFLQGTGLRRREAEHVRPCDIHIKRNGGIVIDIKGKGGKWRSVPVRAGFELKVYLYASDAKTPIWGKIPGACDVHSYRREYAQALYQQHARAISLLRHDEKYFCRGDRKGTVYDKQAMLAVSKALGHNRLDVVASHYL